MNHVVELELNPNLKEELIKKTKDYITRRELRLSEIELEHPGYKKICKFFPKNNDEFDGLVKAMVKQCKNKYLSQSTIESECTSYFDNIITNGINTNEGIGEKLDSLVEVLEDKVGIWQVVIPIDHLIFENLYEIEMGPASLVHFSQIKEEISKRISLSKMNDTTRLHLEQNIQDVNNKVCAKIEVIAEEKNQYQKAMVEFENIINLFRSSRKLRRSKDWPRRRLLITS